MRSCWLCGGDRPETGLAFISQAHHGRWDCDQFRKARKWAQTSYPNKLIMKIRRVPEDRSAGSPFWGEPAMLKSEAGRQIIHYDRCNATSPARSFRPAGFGKLPIVPASNTGASSAMPATGSTLSEPFIGKAGQVLMSRARDREKLWRYAL